MRQQGKGKTEENNHRGNAQCHINARLQKQGSEQLAPRRGLGQRCLLRGFPTVAPLLPSCLAVLAEHSLGCFSGTGGHLRGSIFCTFTAVARLYVGLGDKALQEMIGWHSGTDNIGCQEGGNN